MTTDSNHVDVNAVAGAFTEVFGIDVTTTVLTCAACGTPSRLAKSRVDSLEPDIVIRCPSCLEVLVRLVRRPADAMIDLRGALHWTIPMTDPS
jgi:hypothetical protein